MALDVTWNSDAANKDCVFIHLSHPDVDEHTVEISFNRLEREWIVIHRSLGMGTSQSRLKVPKRRHFMVEKSVDD